MIDGALSAKGATPELVATIARAGPYGAGNAEPFAAAHTIAYAEEAQAHVRVQNLGDGKPRRPSHFVAGQRLGQALLNQRGNPVHVAGALAVDRWQGAERVQLRVCDLAPVAGAISVTP